MLVAEAGLGTILLVNESFIDLTLISRLYHDYHHVPYVFYGILTSLRHVVQYEWTGSPFTWFIWTDS